MRGREVEEGRPKLGREEKKEKSGKWGYDVQGPKKLIIDVKEGWQRA